MANEEITGCAPKVSIVLSAYNGERFLKEQLDSLVAQTLQPDEVLIVDDCSTDGTFKLIEQYIAKHELSGWSVRRNASNRGWIANFRTLLLEATGDYIFPCDQDDIWNPEKLLTMVATMEECPHLNLLACLVAPFYEDGSQKTYVDSSSVGDQLLEIPRFNPSLLYITRPGCAFCLRSSFVRSAEPYWDETYPHDSLLWDLAAITNTIGLLNEPLISFRRHSGNASARKKVNTASRIGDLDSWVRQVDVMERYCGDSIDEDTRMYLEQYRAWIENRKQLVQGNKRLRNLRAARKHKDYYANKASWIIDLACSFGLTI